MSHSRVVEGERELVSSAESSFTFTHSAPGAFGRENFYELVI